jgi:hypothetical protein
VIGAPPARKWPGPARRARRALAATVVSVLVVLLITGTGLLGSPVGAEIDCVVHPDAPECRQQQPTTTTTAIAPTTTTVVPPTTEPTTTTTAPEPVEPTTTTTEPAVVVPRTSPPTTARRVPTTAAPVTTATLSATTVTTHQDLLVPGDGTAGAESTTTTSPTGAQGGGPGGPSDGALLALITGGLVVLAGLVAVLTWRYWVATRPAPAPRRVAPSTEYAPGAPTPAWRPYTGENPASGT